MYKRYNLKSIVQQVLKYLSQLPTMSFLNGLFCQISFPLNYRPDIVDIDWKQVPFSHLNKMCDIIHNVCICWCHETKFLILITRILRLAPVQLRPINIALFDMCVLLVMVVDWLVICEESERSLTNKLTNLQGILEVEQ